MIKVQIRAGLGWPEIWSGRVEAIPRVGDELEVDEITYTVHRVMWSMPSGRGNSMEVLIYAK